MENLLCSSGIFPGNKVIADSSKDPERFARRNIEPEEFGDRIIFMSMFNDIDWTAKGNEENCISNSDKVKMYAKRFSKGHWTFFGLGDEKKSYGKSNYQPHAKLNSVASQIVPRFKETGHRVLHKCQCIESWKSEKIKMKRKPYT